MREKRDVRPVILKFGVALSLSLGGILYSIIRNKGIRPSESPPSPPPSECGNRVDLAGGKAGLKHDYHVLQTSSSSCNNASVELEKHEESCLSKTVNENYNGDKDGYLFLEFQELVKEFDLAATEASNSPIRDVETPKSDIGTPRAYKCAENDYYEREIKTLRNMVRILTERERTLEIQLLEYYGLKEHETAVTELQNRLKINNVEAKLFTLKIGSLQADNRKLEAQVADYAKVVAELEAARTKTKLLNNKFKFEAEQNKQQILTLQQKVTKLKDQELMAVGNDMDIELKLQKLKDLESAAEELRKSNYSLRIENSSLAQRMESTQVLATHILEDQEIEALKEESHCLRRENEDLSKQIEQLQADRCGDAEELVYLRWVNACLRYELRNYKLGLGKTVARDLSKTSSPNSAEKAKQLILEYGNMEGLGEKGINVMDLDFDWWSSSQPSYFTDSGECDDSSFDSSSANKTNTSSKTKFFGKLRRLIRGKDNNNHSWGSSLETSASIDDMLRVYSGDKSKTSSHDSSRNSLDVQISRSAKVENHKVFEGIMKSPQENQVDEISETLQISELLKYAEVLKYSHGTASKVLLTLS